MMAMLSNAINPQAMLMQIASKQPKMKQILDMVGNGDPKQIFFNACKQKGVIPDQILSKMK